MAQRLTLTLPGSDHQYDLHIGPGLLARLGELIPQTLPKVKRCLVVTDSTVGPLYLKPLESSLAQAGIQSSAVRVQPGETHKTLDTMVQLYEAAQAFGMKRTDAVVALGGGIVGDMAGFLAASILRGVPFIQCPTTLLAQVDSSVGGKVGINWQGLKNWIGAFYQPHLVVMDTTTLTTLPDREVRCGLAEVIKYGFIASNIDTTTTVPVLETVSALKHPYDPTAWGPLIESCCQLKAAVVMADPLETTGHRALLNFGHTFGHAYETLLDHQLNHGEAVGLGMVQAFRLSVQLGLIDAGLAQQAIDMIAALGLPMESPVKCDSQSLIATMAHDKKVLTQGQLRFILPVAALGRVQLVDSVTADDLDIILTNPRLYVS